MGEPVERAAGAGPVFVDPSGRRRRTVARAGVGIAGLLVLYAVAMVVLALLGVRVDAPGLPSLSNVPSLVGGSSAGDPGTRQSSGGANTPTTPASRPISTGPTGTSAPTSPVTRAPSSPSPTIATATPHAETVHPTTVATPAAVATATATPTSPTRGKSAAAPGATHRATPTTGGQSTTRPSPHSGGKSASAPRPTAHPTHP